MDVLGGRKTNSQVLLAALQKCSKTKDLEMGKRVHAQAIEAGHYRNLYVATALIKMYAKCGSIGDANEVFENLKHADVVSWNVLILGYADNGQGQIALNLFTEMSSAGHAPNSVTFVAALKSCTSTAANRWLERGKQIHSFVLENGCSSDVYVQNTLIDMYAKCGRMVDARQVFDCMQQRTVVSWTALIMGYAENGQGDTCLDLFRKMTTEGGSTPNPITLIATIKACTSLALEEEASRWPEYKERGKAIYNFALEICCDSNLDTNLLITLVDLFSKCGCMNETRQIFERMKSPTLVCWTTLILGYVDNGEAETALNLFSRMRSEGPTPDSVTLVAALKACSTLAVKAGASRWVECRDRGKEIHSFYGCISDTCVQSTLVDLYAKCGSMADAHEVFDAMPCPDVVSWNVLILGYTYNGQGHTALDLFIRLRTEGPAPDSATFSAAFKTCASLAVKGVSRWAECGKIIHNVALENVCSSDVYMQHALVDMYVKFCNLRDACEVFYSMKHPTVVSWTALILGFADNGEGHTALDVFTRTKGVAPDSLTFVAAFKACACLAVKGGWAVYDDGGKGLHNFAVEYGCMSNVYLQSTLIDMYAKCGRMVEARELFDGMKVPDAVSWTALILGYADNGQGQTALDLFTRMKTEGPAADSVTIGAALKACGLVGALEFGRTIHSEMDNGGKNDLNVTLVNCLVDFYAKCGSLVEAKRVFDMHVDKRDVITWNTLLSGFSSCGDQNAVFGLFQLMQTSCRPDGITLLCILTCCSHVGLVDKGKECFDTMPKKYGIIPTVDHYNCMVDIFGRANMLDDAIALLKHMPCSPDAVTWNTILSACRKWKNVKIGRLAFQSLIDLNDKDETACIRV